MKLFYAAGIAAIVNLLLAVVMVFLGENFPLLLISIATTIVLHMGTYMLGKKYGSKLLQVTSVLIIFATLASTALPELIEDPNAPLEQVLPDLFLGASMLAIMGAIVIFFGVGLLSLRKQFGKTASLAGYCYVIAGACMVTIIGMLLSILFFIPGTIALAFILFKVGR